MTTEVSESTLVRQIVWLSFAAFASAFSARVSDPLLPQLAANFSVTTGEAAQAVSAFALAYGVLQLFYGPLGDRYGKYRVIVVTTLASAIGALGSAVALEFNWLVAFRFLTGATAAAIIPLAMAWIADRVPYQRRQHVLAYFLTGQIFGVVGGQMLGGILADLTGWRGAFWCVLGFYLAVGILLLVELRRTPAIDTAHVAGGQQIPYLARVAGILRERWSLVVLSCAFAEGAILFGALAFIPSYLHHRFGISLALAGTSFGMFGIGGLSYTSSAKYFVRKLGERKLAAAGGGFLGLAFLTLIAGGHWLWVIPAAWFAGVGYYSMHNTLQINATQMAPLSRGTAVSLFACCFFLGQSMGVWLAAIIIDHLGFVAVFGLSAVLLPVIGGFFSQRLGSRAKLLPGAGL